MHMLHLQRQGVCVLLPPGHHLDQHTRVRVIFQISSVCLHFLVDSTWLWYNVTMLLHELTVCLCCSRFIMVFYNSYCVTYALTLVSFQNLLQLTICAVSVMS